MVETGLHETKEQVSSINESESFIVLGCISYKAAGNMHFTSSKFFEIGP